MSGLGLPVFCCLPLPVRACGTTGRSAAPAAPACFQHAGNPYADASAHGVTSLERSLRLRSAREWVFRLAECPQASSLPLTSPGSCELSPGHPLGPFARVAGVCSLNASGPYPWRRRTGIVANHRIPLRDRKTVRTRPHIGAGRVDNNRKYVSGKEKFVSLSITCSEIE